MVGATFRAQDSQVEARRGVAVMGELKANAVDSWEEVVSRGG